MMADVNSRKQYIDYIHRVILTKPKYQMEYNQLKTLIKKKFVLSESECTEVIQHCIDRNWLSIENNNLTFDILANETRKRIFNLIQQYPGLYTYTIKKHLRLGTNQILWHLSFLIESGYISDYELGKTHVFAIPMIPRNDVVFGYLCLKDSIRNLCHLLFDHPEGLSIFNLTEKLKLSRGSIIHILSKLTKFGLLTTQTTQLRTYFLDDQYRDKFKQIIQNFTLTFC